MAQASSRHKNLFCILVLIPLSVPTSMKIFLTFLDEVTRIVFNSKLRIILRSKSEQFKNTEPRKKQKHKQGLEYIQTRRKHS